jgi:chromate transporter
MSTPADTQRGSLGEIARVFLKLGFLAFGGPAAHTAMMQDELVHRRRWLSEERFLEAVAAVQVVPGPNSTELAIHMGQLRGGTRGLLVAGACFIGPAVLIILPLAILYVEIGRMSDATQAGLATVMQTVSAAVIGIIFVAGYRLARTATREPFAIAVAVLAFVGGLSIPAGWQPEILMLATAAVLGIARESAQRGPAAALLLPLAVIESPDWLQFAGFFLKVGGTLYGSGYVLVSYLETGLTADGLGWLTSAQVADAVAVGQVTPGPLLTTSTFAGYVIASFTFGQGLSGSIGGALLATAAMFLPAFVFVLLLGPILNRLRQRAWARGMLGGMGSAAVGLIFVACVQLLTGGLVSEGGIDWLLVATLLVTVAALLRFGVNATWLIGMALALGLLRVAIGAG